MSGDKRRASKTTEPVKHIEVQAALQGLKDAEALYREDIAVSHALHRGDLAPVVRYLREVVTPLIQHRVRGQFGSTATIGLLADMIEGRESTPWHLKRVWPRRGKPTDVAGTTLKNIAIGARIAVHPLRKEKLDAAVKAIEDQYGITKAHAYKCFHLFEKYNFHNERGEPMPIPERPTRRRVKAAI